MEQIRRLVRNVRKKGGVRLKNRILWKWEKPDSVKL